MGKGLIWLKFWSTRILGSAALIVLCLGPLGWGLSRWSDRLTSRELRSRCEVQSLESLRLIENYMHNPSSEDLLLSLNDDKWVWNKLRLNDLGLPAEGLAQLVAQTRSSLGTASNARISQIRPLRFEETPLFLHLLSNRTVKLLYPLGFLEKVTKTSDCRVQIRGESGHVFYDSHAEDVKADTEDALQARGLYGFQVISQVRVIDANSLTPKMLMMFTIFGLFTLMVVIAVQSRMWFEEWRATSLMTESLTAFSKGNTSARPRLFLDNHMGLLEQALEQVALYIQDLKTFSTSANRTKVEVEKLKPYLHSSQQRNVCVMRVTFANTQNLPDKLMHQKLCDFFSSVVQKNGGVVDYTNLDGFQATWGLIQESELDAANSVMCAVDFKVAIEALNKKMEFGIGVHKAQAEVVFAGSEEVAGITAYGSMVVQTKLFAEQAMHSTPHILISDKVASQVESFFVLKVFANMVQGIRLYSIEGIVDTEANNRLFKRAKT